MSPTDIVLATTGAVAFIFGFGYLVGYCILAPLSEGRPPFSPPDGSPAQFEPFKPWRKVGQ